MAQTNPALIGGVFVFTHSSLGMAPTWFRRVALAAPTYRRCSPDRPQAGSYRGARQSPNGLLMAGQTVGRIQERSEHSANTRLRASQGVLLRECALPQGATRADCGIQLGPRLVGWASAHRKHGWAGGLKPTLHACRRCSPDRPQAGSYRGAAITERVLDGGPGRRADSGAKRTICRYSAPCASRCIASRMHPTPRIHPR